MRHDTQVFTFLTLKRVHLNTIPVVDFFVIVKFNLSTDSNELGNLLDFGTFLSNLNSTTHSQRLFYTPL